MDSGNDPHNPPLLAQPSASSPVSFVGLVLKLVKDLALLISKEAPYQTTQEFLASIDENLKKAMA